MCVLSLGCKSSSCILVTSPLSSICIVNIFSPSVACLFISLNCGFWKEFWRSLFKRVFFFQEIFANPKVVKIFSFVFFQILWSILSWLLYMELDRSSLPPSNGYLIIPEPFIKKNILSPMHSFGSFVKTRFILYIHVDLFLDPLFCSLTYICLFFSL